MSEEQLPAAERLNEALLDLHAAADYLEGYACEIDGVLDDEAEHDASSSRSATGDNDAEASAVERDDARELELLTEAEDELERVEGFMTKAFIEVDELQDLVSGWRGDFQERAGVAYSAVPFEDSESRLVELTGLIQIPAWFDALKEISVSEMTSAQRRLLLRRSSKLAFEMVEELRHAAENAEGIEFPAAFA